MAQVSKFFVETAKIDENSEEISYRVKGCLWKFDDRELNIQ